MRAARLHIHPKSGLQVYGELLQPGNMLEATDLYPGDNGQWLHCQFEGMRLCAGSDVIWIRPIVHTLPDGSTPGPSYHAHPHTLAYVYGTLIKPCAVLEPTDVYSSSSGKWEPCPCPGIVLECLCNGVVWVRPAPEPK